MASFFHSDDEVFGVCSEKNSQFLVGFQWIVYDLPVMCNQMENVVSWGDLHFEENLIGFDVSHPFHCIWVKELDHRSFFFLFIQENQLIPFLVVLDILDNKFLQFDLCYFLSGFWQFFKCNKLIMSSWNNILFLAHKKERNGSDQLLMVLKHMQLFQLVIPYFDLSRLWARCKLMLITPFHVRYHFLMHVLLLVQVFKLFTKNHAFSVLVNCH